MEGQEWFAPKRLGDEESSLIANSRGFDHGPSDLDVCLLAGRQPNGGLVGLDIVGLLGLVRLVWMGGSRIESLNQIPQRWPMTVNDPHISVDCNNGTRLGGLQGKESIGQVFVCE